ncbi:hypothetical protein CsSME_00036273 [Camellia sinensis var. sinensis]
MKNPITRSLFHSRQHKFSASWRPIRIDGALKVGQKKGSSLVDLEDGAQTRKKVQLGTPATRSISIYSSRSPMKQRLDQYAKKGKEDGLYISCVASLGNLWVVVMDARTGFTSKVHELSPVFLHKEWILEQWDKNYYITSLAGASNGSALVESLRHYYDITPK